MWPHRREHVLENSTGSLDRMAVFSRPLASAGVDGMAMGRPGVWKKWVSVDCEWCRP